MTFSCSAASNIESVRLSRGTLRNSMLAVNSLCSRFGAARRTLYASASVATSDSSGLPLTRSAHPRTASQRFRFPSATESGAPIGPRSPLFFSLALRTSAATPGWAAGRGIPARRPPHGTRPPPTTDCRRVRDVRSAGRPDACTWFRVSAETPRVRSVTADRPPSSALERFFRASCQLSDTCSLDSVLRWSPLSASGSSAPGSSARPRWLTISRSAASSRGSEATETIDRCNALSLVQRFDHQG